MDPIEEAKKNKLQDIKAIDFGENVGEITSSMEIILTMYEMDDDPEIIGACKDKLKEGVSLLKKYGAGDRADNYKVNDDK